MTHKHRQKLSSPTFRVLRKTLKSAPERVTASESTSRHRYLIKYPTIQVKAKCEPNSRPRGSVQFITDSVSLSLRTLGFESTCRSVNESHVPRAWDAVPSRALIDKLSRNMFFLLKYPHRNKLLNVNGALRKLPEHTHSFDKAYYLLILSSSQKDLVAPDEL